MAILEVNNLKKSFGELEVLKGVSFSLEKGEILSVIGSSGGGKTTLLRILNSLETATEGKITIDGEAVYDSAAPEDSPVDETGGLKMGLVFQGFNLFPQYTVLGNLTLAPITRAKKDPDFKKNKKEIVKEIEAKAEEILESVGLSEKRDSYPYQLSGGQQQRVAIARALMLSPKILCFDEPTSALDPELTGEVLKVIRSLKDQGRTMIIVTHELAFAESVSDKVIFMADGKIEEMGSPEDIFKNPKCEKTKRFLEGMLDPNMQTKDDIL